MSSYGLINFIAICIRILLNFCSTSLLEWGEKEVHTNCTNNWHCGYFGELLKDTFYSILSST